MDSLYPEYGIKMQNMDIETPFQRNGTKFQIQIGPDSQNTENGIRL